MSALFLIWYFAYVLLGAFAHDFMAIKVWGVSISLAFILGIVGMLTSPDRGDREINAEFEVRSLTGIDAEKALAAH
jgi:hypothetical protein